MLRKPRLRPSCLRPASWDAKQKAKAVPGWHISEKAAIWLICPRHPRAEWAADAGETRGGSGDESPSPLPLRLALLLFIIRRALDQCIPELASLGSGQFRDIDQEGPLDSLLP